jgi:hypothetical protein
MMADLLLAGPILRRVTPEIVCVWFATTQKIDFKLTIMKAKQPLGVSDLLKIDQQRCQLGQNLFIYLLQAVPIGNNPPQIRVNYPYDTLLSYQIEQVSGSTTKAVNLKDLQLTYGNSPQPTFFIPTHLNRVLHGSCRKPHGHTADNGINYDALGLGDALLAEHHGQLATRPALLLLTGDQIYADDVADPVFALIKQQAPGVLGFQELLPQQKNGSFNPANLPIRGRKELADDEAGFSSQHPENHLFSFAEFAAMYIYIFGNAEQWVLTFLPEHKLSSAEQATIQAFHDTLPKVRRLLANIPTYMIFDDHDVTDDWNITGGWYDKVRDLPLGHRIISNALAAYWAFQGWGNEPDNFDYGMVRSIVDYLADSHPSGNLAQQFDLNTWKHRGWGYSIPTNPPIIVIDSRTQRQPDGTFYPPQLLDRYALDWLRIEWLKLKVLKEEELKQGLFDKLPEWPVFVAATPVMGFAPVEGLQQFALWSISVLEDNLIVRFIERQFKSAGIATAYLGSVLDAEGWLSNRDGFGNFMNCLVSRMGITKCVFLSGDVHYSFTADATYSVAVEGHNEELRCWQLTSSSLCNKPNPKQEELLSKVSKGKVDAGHNNWWAYNPKQCWKTKIKYLNAVDTSDVRVTCDCNLGMLEFVQGLPVKHSLIDDKVGLVFLLENGD